MSHPDLFYPDCDPVKVAGGPDYVLYSCLQWQHPNLCLLPEPTKQTFCVMYSDFLDDRFITLLERAHLRGALAAVKLISIFDDDLHIFLDGEISHNDFLSIKALWERDTSLYSGRHYKLAFETEVEVYSGHFEHPFGPLVKEVLGSTALGLSSLETPGHAEEIWACLIHDWCVRIRH